MNAARVFMEFSANSEDGSEEKEDKGAGEDEEAHGGLVNKLVSLAISPLSLASPRSSVVPTISSLLHRAGGTLLGVHCGLS